MTGQILRKGQSRTDPVRRAVGLVSFCSKNQPKDGLCDSAAGQCRAELKTRSAAI